MDLREVVDEVRAASQPTAARAGVEFALSVPAGVVNVHADARALARVVTNLVINAIAHTPEGGAVSVEIVVSGDVALVTVDDTGPGIDDGDLTRIFEVAYRGDRRARHQPNAAYPPVPAWDSPSPRDSCLRTRGGYRSATATPAAASRSRCRCTAAERRSAQRRRRELADAVGR